MSKKFNDEEAINRPAVVLKAADASYALRVSPGKMEKRLETVAFHVKTHSVVLKLDWLYNLWEIACGIVHLVAYCDDESRVAAIDLPCPQSDNK